MRNKNDSDEWTLPSTAETDSYIDIGSPVDGRNAVLALAVTPRHEFIGVDSPLTTTQACVTVKACDIPLDDDTRSPVDIVVALDISVSMTGKKLKLCKQTLEMLVRVLGSKDRFGLISYGSEAWVSIPAQFMSHENKKRVLSMIKTICTNGGTNLSGGFTLAAQEMQSISSPNQVRSIFLLTDGCANEGVTDTPGLVSIVRNSTATCVVPTEQFRHSCHLKTEKRVPVSDKEQSTVDMKQPISVHCFGYGSDHDSGMLQAIADATPGGTYYFVESDANVASAFGDAIGGLLSVVAQSAVITIAVPPAAADLGVRILDVYHEEKIQRDNGTYTVSLGDFYAEETRDVLFEMEVARVPHGSLDPIGHALISLHYTDTINYTSCTVDDVLCCVQRPAGAALSKENPHVKVQWLRLFTAREIEAADRDARSDNLSSARTRLTHIISNIQASPSEIQSHPLVMGLESDVNALMQGFDSRERYQTFGKHLAMAKQRTHMTQRCVEASPDTVNAYRGKTKMRLSTMFQKK